MQAHLVSWHTPESARNQNLSLYICKERVCLEFISGKARRIPGCGSFGSDDGSVLTQVSYFLFSYMSVKHVFWWEVLSPASSSHITQCYQVLLNFQLKNGHACYRSRTGGLILSTCNRTPVTTVTCPCSSWINRIACFEWGAYWRDSPARPWNNKVRQTFIGPFPLQVVPSVNENAFKHEKHTIYTNSTVCVCACVCTVCHAYNIVCHRPAYKYQQGGEVLWDHQVFFSNYVTQTANL